MEIILVRHGKPDMAFRPKLNAASYANWLRHYNRSNICTDSKPCSSIVDKLDGCYVVSSDLTRAIESVEICGFIPAESDSIYREMHIPYYRLPFKFKAMTWVYLCRALWTFGVKGNFESYQEAKSRAKIASDKLILLSQKHNKVALFAHGYINLHIRKQLAHSGWNVTEQDNYYWGVSRLTLTDG